MKWTTKDPWAEIDPGPSPIYNANRVETDQKLEFFWAKGADSKCALILRHKMASNQGIRLPKLKGVEVSVAPQPESGSANLLFKLHESEHRDIFYQLCMNLIQSAKTAKSEREIVALTIARAWRWHHLLRGGSDGRLSLEEQKGLIGELYVLKSVLIPNIASFTEGLACWTGPSGSPKDFNIGNIGIEVKARSGVSEPYINISSSHQLDDSNVHSLYLCVVTLNEATSEVPESFTLMDKINEMLKFYETEPTAHARFIDLLNAYPHDQNQLDLEDKYEDRFVFGGVEYYNVLNGFPRIVGPEIHQAVIDVRYRIPLNSCSDFIVPETDITTYLN